MSWFTNKKVWVTGASSGIGKALAEELAQQGASLVLSSRRQDVLEQLKSSLDNPEQHVVVPLDLEQFDTLAGIVERAQTTTGQIDILINNGGISQRELAMNTSIEVDQKLMNINYFGTIAMSKALLPVQYMGIWKVCAANYISTESMFWSRHPDMSTPMSH